MAAIAIAYATAPAHPTTVDGQIYRFMAQCFAHGAAGTPETPHPELFHYRFVLPHPDGRLFGIFPPGWPAFLAPFEALGLGQHAGPLLLGMLVLLSAALARAVFPAVVGVPALTAWLLALSPMTTALAGSTMSHTFASVLTVTALLLARRATSWRGSLGVGLALGALFDTRPLNAVLLAVPIGLALVRADRPPLRALLAGTLAAALVSLGAFAQNQAVTGDSGTIGQDAWFRLTEWNPDCHRLGFGDDIGCVGEHMLERPGHHLADAAAVTWTRLVAWNDAALGPTPGWLLMVVPFFRWRRDGARASAVLALHVGLTVAGYALFYYHGNAFGPRLWAEALPGALILVASGALMLPWRTARFAGVALLLVGLPFGHLRVGDDVTRSQFLPMDEVERALEAAPGEARLVFVEAPALSAWHASKGLGLGYAMGGLPRPESPLVFAHALRDEGPAWLARTLPGHTPYLLRLRPNPGSLSPGLLPELLPWSPPLPGAPLHIDAIARWPLAERPPCGAAIPADVEGLQGVHFHTGSPCRFDLGRAPSAGRYRIEAVAAAAGSIRITAGDWSAALEGADGPVSFGAAEALVTESARVLVDVDGDAWLREVTFAPAQ